MRIALDSDVCIYATTATRWTTDVRATITGADLVGSVLLPVEATAIEARADVFLTNNMKDFGAVTVEGPRIMSPRAHEQRVQVHVTGRQ